MSRAHPRGVSITWGPKQIEIAANIHARLLEYYGEVRGVWTAIDKEIADTIDVTLDVARARRQMWGPTYRNPGKQARAFERKYAVPQSKWTERDAREHGYDARDLTGHLMGDPPVGHSMLERR